MKKDNIIQEKSYQFSIRIIGVYQFLVKVKKEFILSKQLLRSSTSIGANIEEAIGGQSKNDFVSKIKIAYKEARETNYWIRLLRDTGYLTAKQAESLLLDLDDILKILGKIQITIRNS